MNAENFNEAMANAKTASSNENNDVALMWYDKALEENPNSVEALSEAGAVCVSDGNFDKAFEYFNKALEIDPLNGDNLFNLATAYFFNGDFSKSLELYTDAETKECSEDVRQRIYYQLAMLCSIRQDVKSALINFEKYIAADKSGKAGLDPDVISEKIKLYMAIEDYNNAEKCAAQWVAVAPSELSPYMVYFSILVARGDYKSAEIIVNEAEKYADIDDDQRKKLELEKAALKIAKADADSEHANEYLQEAYDNVIRLRRTASAEVYEELTLTLAEICMKMGKYEDAVNEAVSLIPKDHFEKFEFEIKKPEPANLEENEIQEQLQHDMDAIDEKISNGEIDETIAEKAEVYYDDEGDLVRDYPDEFFAGLENENNDSDDQTEVSDEDNDVEASEKSGSHYDRVYFILISCYSAMEDYENTYTYSRMMKHSSNEYFSCFGKYAEAYSMRKLERFSAEEKDSKYSEVIAYFRSLMMSGTLSNYAVIFRARMYAETGKFAKAEEMAGLLSDDDKKAVDEYIASCKNNQ